MQDKFEELKDITEFTYDTAADYFDNPVLAYRNYFGNKTICNLRLSSGSKILDVGCGTGASSLPAAKVVGIDGKVIGIDISEKLLKKANIKAHDYGLKNIEFIKKDMMDLDFEEESFDAVLAVFSIYFVDDMGKQVSDLWRLVKNGGKLALTTWGPRIFEPFYSFWNSEIKRIRPDIYTSFNPWERIRTPDCVRSLLEGAGCTNVISILEERKQPIKTPEDFWILVMGSGFRWIVEQLVAEERNEVYKNIVKWAKSNNVTEIETNVIYTIARKDE